MKFFKRKPRNEKDELAEAIAEFNINGCPLCRPLIKSSSMAKVYHLPNKDTVQMELVDERRNPKRKCLTLCVMDDPNLGWVEAPIRFCPRCGADLVKMIRWNKND